jgi:hypothetical protein
VVCPSEASPEIEHSYDVVIGRAMAESVYWYEIKITEMLYGVAFSGCLFIQRHTISKARFEPSLVSCLVALYYQHTMNGESSSSNAASSLNVGLQDEMLGFAVTPKTDCEHLPHTRLVNDLVDDVIREALCTHCGKPETWLCLTCGGVYCSRYDLSLARCLPGNPIVV